MYKSKEPNNKEKGITLIALIITIIILLILAGVTISLTLGDNGLFNTAKRAVSNYTNAAEQELAYLGQINDMIEETTIQRELTISIDDINTKGFKINITNTKSVKSDNITFEYYLDDEKIASTKEKYYVIDNIDWEQEHTVYVKEFNGEDYKDTSKKYRLKSEGIPKLTSNNSSIITDGEIWYEIESDQWSSVGVYRYYAFDRNFNTYASTTDWCIGNSIGYDFGKPVMIYKASGKIRMKGYKIQASNDNKNWEDIIISSSPCSDGGDDFSNEITIREKYRYWRLYVNGGQKWSGSGALVYELQFNYITINIEN